MLNRLKKYDDDINNFSQNIQLDKKSNLSSTSAYRPIE